MKKRIISLLVISGIFLTLWTSKSSAANLMNFDEYKKELALQDINTMNKRVVNQIEEEFDKTKTLKCRYKEDKNDSNYYIIKPICLRKKEYPELWFRETVNLLWPYIKGFDQEYDEVNTGFNFKGTQAQIDYSKISLGNEYYNTLKQKQIINYLEKNRINIKIHKKYFAKYSAKDFVFYPTLKETKHMSACVKTNYQVSAWPLDGLYVKPWEIFNLNAAISRLPNYCKSINGNKILPFYGGACGTAGQLYRTSLIIPDMTVTKRYPHIRRWAQYYGKTIYGDDAAVLTYDKQLEIKNDGNFPIYFRTLKFKDYTYLVWVSPVNPHKSVKITKNQTGPLTALVTKTTIDSINQKIIKIHNFFSQYYQYFAGGT